MRKKATLSQKIVLVAALPLVFELAVFSTIWLVISKAECQAQTAENASLLVNRTTAITNEIYAAGGSLAAFIATKNKKFEARFNDFIGAAESNLREMEDTELTESQRSIVLEAKQHVGEMLGFLKGMREKIADSSSHRHLLVMHNQHKKAQVAAQTYLDNMQQILASFEEDARIQRAELAKSKALVARVIAGGMLVSLLLAMTISLGFARKVISQIQDLRDKAHNLVTLQQLSKPADGGDEIAELDRTLYEVSSLLIANSEKERELEAMKGTLVAMVSHDLRAPLTSTQAFLALLNEGKLGTVNAQGRLTLRSLLCSLDHVSSLVDDMLSFASEDWRDATSQRAESDLGVIIKDATDIVRAAAELKEIGITVADYPDALIHADENRLVQVLVNILSNSIKYCPTGTSVRISTTLDRDNCHITIADDGPGVSCADPFSAFTRGTNASNISGRGLGLFLSKQVIEAHGGTIALNSEVATGTQFEITLPTVSSSWAAHHESKAS